MALAAAGLSVGRPGDLAGGLPAGRCLWPAGQGVAVAAADPAGARPDPGYQQGVALALFGVLGALVWWQGLASVLASEPGIWLALLPAILWSGWTSWRGDSEEGLGFALAFIWLALVIGIDGSLLIAQLTGALAAFAGFRALLGAFAGSGDPGRPGLSLAFVQMLAWQYVEVPLLVLLPVWLLPLLERALHGRPDSLAGGLDPGGGRRCRSESVVGMARGITLLILHEKQAITLEIDGLVKVWTDKD